MKSNSLSSTEGVGDVAPESVREVPGVCEASLPNGTTGCNSPRTDSGPWGWQWPEDAPYNNDRAAPTDWDI